jgi:hypothetical protein
MAQKTIIVAGMIASDPYQGGASWAVLQYILGFQRLGHRVFFIEPLAVSPDSSLAWMEGRAAKYFREVADRFALHGQSALWRQGTTETIGLPYNHLLNVASQADLLVNISGLVTDPGVFDRVACRAYLDLDPAFNQLWHTVLGIDRHFAGHDFFFTVGSSLGRPSCTIPTVGFTWMATLPPVVMHEWPLVSMPKNGSLTTVANWRSYGSIEYEGVSYGQKAHSFRKYVELPRRSPISCELALSIDPGETSDLVLLQEHGWRVVDPENAAGTPDRYRAFIQESFAELGVAKLGYVRSRSGWFSDRSACYLATGRPVIAEDTGFPDVVPTGTGLLVFRTMDDLLAGIDSIRSKPQRHGEAARRIAREYFDSDRVLTSMLTRIGV